MATAQAANDTPVQSPPDDSISSISFSPKGNVLVAGSWNKQDGQRVLSGSCDKTAKVWDLNTQQSNQVALHDAPIKDCAWIDQQVFVTASWDKTIKYWDLRSQQPSVTVNLPERVYAMSVSSPLVTVALANKGLLIFNTADPSRPFRTIESPLKMQSRCIANFFDKSGFAVGSIEGRVGIQYVDEKNASKNFAFKCHRVDDQVFAVNSIAFHPKGTFATAGSDGSYAFWDKDAKQRLKAFKRNDQQIPITCSAFNFDGSIYAYALSYDWSQGVGRYDKSKPNQIMLHSVKPEEVEPKRASGFR